MTRALLCRAVAVGVLVLLGACTSPPPPAVEVAQPPPPAPLPSRAAQPLQLHDASARCASISGMARSGLEVVRAERIGEGVSQAFDPILRRAVGPPLPEHCRVEGRLRPPADAGAVPTVDFEMRLPSRWNGRLLFQGSFELRPRAIEAFGRTTGAGGMEDNALSQGYAVLASHAGARPGAAPTSDRAESEAALAPAAAAAKALIEGYYGRAADRSYFVGCSAGGREGLVFAQRWPQTFDGIVAVAPLLREGDAALAAAWTMQRFLVVAPQARPGPRVLSRAFTVEELFVVADAVLKQCDALDGARDGFVMDMAGCRFDPAALSCKRGGARSCLPTAKVQALVEAMRGPHDAAGGALYAPWPWDPGIAAPGWRAWTLGSAGPGATPNPRSMALIEPFLRRPPNEPSSAQPAAKAPEIARDPARLQIARGADDPLMAAPFDAFERRGGKLLLVHGAADPVVSAWVTVDYQQRLDEAASRSGAPGAAGYARTFVVPGMNHCAGGPSVDRFDALAALVAWVEQEQPPRRIEARGSAVLGNETRPLCPWPQVARYRGAGSLHDSASYECR